MQLFGYKDQGLPIEDIRSDELAEVTLVAKPGELRRIAKFLQFAADEMERMGNDYSHLHLSDQDKTFEESPHFVVFNPEVSE